MCLGSSEVPLHENEIVGTASSVSSVSSINPVIVVEGLEVSFDEVEFDEISSDPSALSILFVQSLSVSSNRKSMAAYDNKN